MPGKDGLETTAIIRTELGDVRTPIVAMTANAMNGDRERCLEAGMNDHIGKPIDPNALALTLARCLDIEAVGDMRPHKSKSRLGRDDEAAPFEAPGVDVAFGLRSLNGNAELLQHLLHVFVEEHADQAKKAAAAFRAGDWDRVHRIAHTLKGVALTLGATKVGSIAAELEALARLGSADRDERHAEALIEALSVALDQIVVGVAALEKDEEPVPEPASEPSVDTRGLIDEVDALERLLSSGDADAELQSEQLSRAFENTQLRVLADLVARAAGRYDFEGAKSSLADLRDALVNGN